MLKSSPEQVLQLEQQNECYSLSTYRGEITQRVAVETLAKVKVAFPGLSKEFFSVLIERMMEKGFNDQRMTDAINNVIDTCQYPTPTLANFLSFDRRAKVYDYNQLCGMVLRQEASWNDFDKITINGKLYWVRKSEKDLYNLPDEL